MENEQRPWYQREDNLRALYTALNANPMDWTTRKWDTLKLATSSCSIGLVTASAVAYKVEEPFVRIAIGLVLILANYPVFHWTLSNIRRETALQ
jgi:hypothetical protein